MKTKNVKAAKPTATSNRGLGRENKDVTCAVRLPPSMHKRLCELAKIEGSSISDIIRDSLGYKMDLMEEVVRERNLKQARYDAEMAKLVSGS